MTAPQSLRPETVAAVRADLPWPKKLLFRVLEAAGRRPAAPAADEPVIDLVALETEEDLAPAFPILDYDTLTVSQLLPLLPKLYADELPVVLAHEQAGKARRTLLTRLESLLAKATDCPDDLTLEQHLATRASG